MLNYNSETSTNKVVLFSSVLMLYSIYFDIVDLQTTPTIFYFAQKIFFMILPFVFLNTFRQVNIDKKVFLIGMLYTLYSILHTYFISINYMISSFQVTLAFTSILFLDKLYYIFLFTFLTLGTSLSILYSPANSGFGQYGHEARFLYLNDFLSLQILTAIIYYFTVFPRTKKLKEELQFSSFGKASSFIIHELQKPIKRLKENISNEKDLVDIQNTLDLAKIIHHNSQLENAPVEVDFQQIINNAILKYQAYISALKIDVIFDFNPIFIKGHQNTFVTIVDNLLKNSIEANVPLPEGQRWIKISYNKSKLIFVNPFDSIVKEADLFLPMKSTKDGNMGVGLFFCKSLAERLDYSFNVRISKKIFEIELNYSQKD